MRHDKPLVPAGHRCNPPKWPHQRTENWECGICGRLLQPHLYGWLEIRGPSE